MLSQVLQSICCAGIDAALAPSHSRQGHLVCVRYRSPCQRLHLEPKLFLPEPHDPCFVIISHGQRGQYWTASAPKWMFPPRRHPWEVASFPQVQVGSHKGWEKPHFSGMVKPNPFGQLPQERCSHSQPEMLPSQNRSSELAQGSSDPSPQPSAQPLWLR